MKKFFNDSTFSFETLRTLAYAPYGGADINEVLATGSKIIDGSFESWHVEWNNLADHVTSRAQQATNENDLVSASKNYFKASNYYRTAEFFLHGNPDDPRLINTWRKSRDTFREALKLSNQQYEIIDIPYENTAMPGYFYKVDDLPRPTMLIHGGYDSTGEELYFEVVVDALERGYNCLTFEGPGQGAMIREQHLPFRSDWENVVSRAIDYLATRTEVIQDKIILMGISFGGLLAPRAAAFDHRIAAVIADDGLFSFQFSKAFSAHSNGVLDFNQIEEKLKQLMAASTQVRWVIENGLFTFGAKSIKELFAKTDTYTLADVVSQIECPVLVCEAENDMFFRNQPQMLFDGLNSPKDLIKFTKEDGAEEHCHLGALNFYNQKVFNWLESTLN